MRIKHKHVEKDKREKTRLQHKIIVERMEIANKVENFQMKNFLEKNSTFLNLEKNQINMKLESDDESFLTTDISTLVDELLSDKVKLDSVFARLEPQLVAIETQKRLKCIKFISNLIQQLPVDYLNELEVNHLSKFLCSKFEDHFSISPAVLPAIEHIIKKNNKNLNEEHALYIIKTMLRDVHVQSLVQSDRFIVYSICDYYVCNYVPIIIGNKCEMDFIYGFIQAMDAEKDPRNLVICFRIIVSIAKNLDLGNFVDDMFEVFSCYFPIDFNTPPNETSITKEGLIGLLRSCFASSSKFAKHAIPLLVEKLSSDVDSAKLDSLLTFIECSKTYDINDYKEYIEPLWTNFQQLTMSTTNAVIEDACLKSIECLTVSIAKCMQREGTLLSLDNFINKCIDCTLIYLKDADLKLIWPSAKCLQSISNATSTTHLIVLKTIVKFLLERLDECKSQSQKRTYCDILWKFVSISHKYSANAPVYIERHKDDLLSLCFGLFNTSNTNQQFVHQALFGLYTLVYFDDLVESADLIKIFDLIAFNLADLLTNKENLELVVKIILLTINKPTEQCYTHILSYVDKSLKSTNPLSILAVLNGLPAASTYNINVLRRERLLKLNLNIFDVVYEYMTRTESSENINVCLEINSKLVEFDYLNDELFLKLVRFIQADSMQATLATNKQIFMITAGLVGEFCVKMKSVEVFNRILFEIDAKHGSVFTDDKSSATNVELNLYMNLFCSLDNALFKTQIEDFFLKVHRKLFTLAVSDSVESGINLLSAQFFASLINKHSDEDGRVSEILNNTFIDGLASDIESADHIKNRLQLWIWLTKALVLREHDLAAVFTSKLIEWLGYSKLTTVCSDGFFVILNEYDRVLNRTKTNARVKLFYRQHFFQKVVSKLKSKFSASTMELKPSYVNALLSTVSFLPKAIIEKELTSMLPILVFSLSSCNSDSLKLCSLKSINDLLGNQSGQSNPLEEYTDEILIHLYALSKYKSSMKIRVLSIGCLVRLSDLNPRFVIKYQRDVYKNLEACLDDPKRLVRQKAVLARNKWCLLSTRSDQ
jgi:DNA repair/transcription protein MET18/MMS19